MSIILLKQVPVHVLCLVQFGNLTVTYTEKVGPLYIYLNICTRLCVLDVKEIFFFKWTGRKMVAVLASS